MLAKLGCTWVVVGHSERREYHNESDELVAAKAKKALDHGMSPIVCVGESLEVREAGDRRAAIEKLVAWAKPGDAIIVVGKGHEVGQIVGTTTHHFDDREEMARALQARAHRAGGK